MANPVTRPLPFALYFLEFFTQYIDMKEEDDREIIEQAKTDSSLFGLIYDKYFKKLYRFIWFRVGKSTAVAQDLVQETFLLAFTHLG